MEKFSGTMQEQNMQTIMAVKFYNKFNATVIAKCIIHVKNSWKFPAILNYKVFCVILAMQKTLKKLKNSYSF